MYKRDDFSKTSLISVRLPEDLAGRLENLAKSTDRSKSYLAACAVEEYLAVQEWQVKTIHDGIAAADNESRGSGPDPP
ncbi:MAG: ribbon-helix-helix protein, CopG family [Deltaproteobacteria bacterium]|nr:ribbon-helix-helix protein, CopG family [Deltaproteobacteria bacterium]